MTVKKAFFLIPTFQNIKVNFFFVENIGLVNGTPKMKRNVVLVCNFLLLELCCSGWFLVTEKNNLHIFKKTGTLIVVVN